MSVDELLPRWTFDGQAPGSTISIISATSQAVPDHDGRLQCPVGSPYLCLALEIYKPDVSQKIKARAKKNSLFQLTRRPLFGFVVTQAGARGTRDLMNVFVRLLLTRTTQTRPTTIVFLARGTSGQVRPGRSRSYSVVVSVPKSLANCQTQSSSLLLARNCKEPSHATCDQPLSDLDTGPPFL